MNWEPEHLATVHEVLLRAAQAVLFFFVQSKLQVETPSRVLGLKPVGIIQDSLTPSGLLTRLVAPQRPLQNSSPSEGEQYDHQV